MDKPEFLSKTFTALKHVPPTGLGFFDATYDPASGKLAVEIRFALSFVSGSVQWVGELQNKFKKDFTDLIPEYWSNKFVIRCTKAGWTEVVVKPEFVLREADDPHFDIRAMGTLGTSNTAVRQKGTGHTDKEKPEHATAKFGSQAGDRWANAEFQLGQVKKHLKKPFIVPLGLEARGQFSFFTMSLLQNYTNNVNHAFQHKKEGDRPKIRLTTVGQNSTQPADRVKAVLQGFGLKKTLMKTSKGTGMGPATGVEIKWESEKAFDKAFPKATQAVPLFSQATVVHEYGHMLGLPDEYNVLCSDSEVPLVEYAMIPNKGEMATHLGNNPFIEASDSEAVRNAQKAFMELCGVAGVLAPPFGQNSMSVMSCGSKFEAQHCVTVWNCLCGMTDGIVQPTEWEIRMA